MLFTFTRDEIRDVSLTLINEDLFAQNILTET